MAARESSHLRGQSRRGVSLVGVLLGVLGVATFAMWAIPAYFERDGVTLDNLSTLLARDLRSAQNRATINGAPARFVFDRDGWRAFDLDGQPLLGGGEHHRIERRLSIDGVFRGAEITRIDAGAGGALEITSRGTLPFGGELELSFLGQRTTVEILRGSGQVVVAGRDEALLNAR